TLTYAWSVTSAPAGAPAVAFSANGSNAAKNTTVTFHAAGSYTFKVTITDASGLTATSSETISVNQTLTSVAVSPTNVTLSQRSKQQFCAIAQDQFKNPLSTQPSFTWSLTGIGSLSSTGLYTAPSDSNGGNGFIAASTGGVSGGASVMVPNTQAAGIYYNPST